MKINNTLMMAALLSALCVGVQAAPITLTGVSARRIDSQDNLPLTRQTSITYTENSIRTGSVDVVAGVSAQHALSTIAFDLGFGATATKTAFQNATEITFEFDLLSIVNGAADLPALNVYYMGTFANAFSTTTIWPDGGTGTIAPLATWTSAAVWNSPTGSANRITLSDTAGNFSGDINITGASNQYAIFMFNTANASYLNTAINRNYTVTTTNVEFTAIPEPSSIALVGIALMSLLALRSRARRS